MIECMYMYSLMRIFINIVCNCVHMNFARDLNQRKSQQVSCRLRLGLFDRIPPEVQQCEKNTRSKQSPISPEAKLLPSHYRCKPSAPTASIMLTFKPFIWEHSRRKQLLNGKRIESGSLSQILWEIRVVAFASSAERLGKAARLLLGSFSLQTPPEIFAAAPALSPFASFTAEPWFQPVLRLGAKKEARVCLEKGVWVE